MLIFSILLNQLFDMIVYCVCLIVLSSFLHHCSLLSIPRASTLSSPGAGDNDFLSRARSCHSYMFVTAGRVKMRCVAHQWKRREQMMPLVAPLWM